MAKESLINETLVPLLPSTVLPQSRAVPREVNRLADAGILKKQTIGRSRLMNANWELSWADPLAQLLDRIIGPLARLSEALGELPEIVSAWIYGSWAERYSRTVGMPQRDIDDWSSVMTST
jgi:hypothetical protein